MSQLNEAHLLRAFMEETWRLKTSVGLPRRLYKDVRIDFVDKYGDDDGFKGAYDEKSSNWMGK